MSIKNINVLAELETIGVGFKWSDDSNVKCKCPFHGDNSPSCFINIETREFFCQASECNARGDIVSFMARVLNTDRKLVIQELAKRYHLETAKTINADVIEKYHARIDMAGPLKKALIARGMTAALIRKYRIGEIDGRVTIPIKNESGMFVNIRKYLPGAPGDQKMRNMRGHGQPRLFPIDQMKYNVIMLCGGEVKAMVAAAELNQYSIGAVCVTAGEGKWSPMLAKHFADKKIYVCMDVDMAGRKASETYAALLHRLAEWVGILHLPLDMDKHPKGDINDYIATEGGKLKPLLKDVEQWAPRVTQIDDNEKPIKTELCRAMHANNISKRMEIEATIAAMDSTPYAVPKTILPTCDKNQSQCAICPLYNTPDGELVHIHPESESILELVSTSKQGMRAAIMSGLSVPMSCKTFNAEVAESYNAEDIRISPKLEMTSESNSRSMMPAICIGDGMDLNENYTLTGRLWPSPKDQKQTLVISKYKTSEDALSSYKAGDTTPLKMFQPDEWTLEGLDKKLDALYTDLEANVTKIFLRRDIHLAVDLTYHSPLWIDFDGKRVKGWVETLVIGDSAQGKSETAISMQQFYRLGEKVECKNATVAGLLGGLQQMGTKWFVSWGVIPTHDRRLVILEELKGAPVEVISRLTDMRSSGIAEIPKIEKRRTHARTRLLALSNPRFDNPLSSYNYGVEAVKELIGALEDIRRFDLVLAVARDDIDIKELNHITKNRPQVEHTHTAALCKSLILWGWTRTKVEIQEPEYILDCAQELSEEYSDQIPIVDRGSQRLKIARLASALAIRTFSSDDGDTVLVRRCHVEYVVAMMKRVYSSPGLGYHDYTQAVEITSSMTDVDAVKGSIMASPFPKDLTQQLLATLYIDLQAVMDFTGYERGGAQEFMSVLVRKHALVRHKRQYRKIGPFVKLLKEMLIEDKFKKTPDYLKDIKF